MIGAMPSPHDRGEERPWTPHELQLPNSDGQLLPGMYAEIKFALPTVRTYAPPPWQRRDDPLGRRER